MSGTAGCDIADTFAAGYERLSNNQKVHLQCLSVFPDDFEIAGAFSVMELDEGTEPEPIMEDFEKLGALQLDHVTGRYRLMDSARKVGLRHIGADEEFMARGRHSAYYQTIIGTANQAYHMSAGSSRLGVEWFEKEKANIVSGHDWAVAHMADLPDCAVLAIAYPDSAGDIIASRLPPQALLKWYEAAVEAASLLGDKRQAAIKLSDVGACYCRLCNYDKAIECLGRAARLCAEVGERRWQAAALSTTANAWLLSGKPQPAIDYFTEAIAIAREIQSPHAEALNLFGLGSAYVEAMDLEKAGSANERSRKLFIELEMRHEELACLVVQGRIFSARKEYKNAIDCFEQAILASRDIADQNIEGSALMNAAIIYATQGEIAKAISHFEDAIPKQDITDIGQAAQSRAQLQKLRDVHS